MNWNTTGRTVAMSVMLTALAQTGCRSTGAAMLKLFGIKTNEVLIGLVADPQRGPKSPLELLNPYASYEGLRLAMSKELGRPVALEACFGLQAEPCLRNGLYQIAFISPSDYARFGRREDLRIIAVASNRSERIARPALLVVDADSQIRSIEELRGKKIAFGPANDARTHLAGLELLSRNKLSKTDLSLEVLPIPGSLRHFANDTDVARSVIYETFAAGFIDEASWEAFPETDGRIDQPARNKLRILARTLAVPDRLVVQSPKLEPEAAEALRGFFLSAGKNHTEALRRLRFAGYYEPTAEVLEACERLSAPESPPPDGEDG